LGRFSECMGCYLWYWFREYNFSSWTCNTCLLVFRNIFKLHPAFLKNKI